MINYTIYVGLYVYKDSITAANCKIGEAGCRKHTPAGFLQIIVKFTSVGHNLGV